MRFIVFLCVCLLSFSAQATDKIFDRVLKERKLRCAYTIYPPFFAKDPNTGKFSGLFYDLLEEMGKLLDVKVIWSEEVSPDGMLIGLKTRRYDAICAGYFITPARANGADFTRPLVFTPSYIYHRPGDNRFKTLADFNTKDVSFITLDGGTSQIYRRGRFPNAKELSVQGLTQPPERLEMVALKKADAAIVEADIGREYIKHNPGKLKEFSAEPVFIGGSAILIPHKEHSFKAFLNSAIDSMHYSGTIARIIQEHENNKGAFLTPAVPYASVK